MFPSPSDAAQAQRELEKMRKKGLDRAADHASTAA